MTRVRTQLTRNHFVSLMVHVGQTDKGETFTDETAGELWDAKKREFEIVDPFRASTNRDSHCEQIMVFLTLG